MHAPVRMNIKVKIKKVNVFVTFQILHAKRTAITYFHFSTLHLKNKNIFTTIVAITLLVSYLEIQNITYNPTAI